MHRKTIFIHVHIPKCAGTTFQNTLKRNFTRPGAYYRETPMVMHKHNSRDMKLMIQRASHIEVFSSHHVSLDLPFELINPNVIALSHVRNPVDRFVSHFYYAKRRGNKARTLKFDSNIVDMTLDDYTDFCINNWDRNMHIKDQLDWLTGKKDIIGIEQIKKLIDKDVLYLFPVERYNDSCILLEKLFPEHFRNCSYVKLNVDSKKKEISDSTLLKIEKLINPMDYKLMEIANSQMNRLKTDYFNNDDQFEKSLDEFHQRCAKFEVNQIKAQKKQELLRKINQILREIISMD